MHYGNMDNKDDDDEDEEWKREWDYAMEIHHFGTNITFLPFVHVLVYIHLSL